ncbi:MAG: glycosyltransferase family A protein [Litorilinea sp.]
MKGKSRAQTDALPPPDAPPVTVIMAVYNGERFLDAAMESVLAQDFTDFEFVIVDDGSTDGTLGILQHYAEQDARIRLITHAQNMGACAALNSAFAVARGKYIACMDADDVTLPHRLGLQVAFLDSHPEIDVLGGQIERIDEQGVVKRDPISRPQEDILIQWTLCFGNPIPHITVMMRRAVLMAVDGYRQEVGSISGDYDLWRRLSPSARFHILPVIFSQIRRSPTYVTNLSSRFADEQKQAVVSTASSLLRQRLGAQTPPNVETLLQKMYARPHGWTLDDATQMARLKYQLTRAFLAGGQLDEDETRLLRTQAATEIYRLFRTFRYQPRAWRMWRWVWKLDRAVALRPFVRPLRKTG